MTELFDGPLDEALFLDRFAAFYHLDRAAVSRDVELVDGLGLDSLDLVEIYAMLEDVADHPIPADILSERSMVGDVIDLFELYRGQASGPGR